MMDKKTRRIKTHNTPKRGLYNAVQSRIGIRERLIAIFLAVKILPLILLAVIAWWSLKDLGDTLRKTAVADSRKALSQLAVENIERITTDAAQNMARFLYSRDADIDFLANYCSRRFLDTDEYLTKIEEFFADFSQNKVSQLRWHKDWKVGEDGMSWVLEDPPAPPKENSNRSTNTENNDDVDGSAFHYRPPHGYGDGSGMFRNAPLFDEIALIDKDGMQIAKYVTTESTKERFPFPREKLDISDPKNTFVKAERYFEELKKMKPGDYYVSDVIGAYTPSRFVGMYTPNYLASKRIDAKIAALETDNEKTHAETIWKLRILSAELRNDEERFNSRINTVNKKIRDEIDRRLGYDAIWKIRSKTLQQVSGELKTLGFAELANEILNIPFKPEEEAFSGAENPLGFRFEGIVRWAKPVLDSNGEIVAYVTFALNHEHLSEIIDHITPMTERYTELSDAFDGNYAFVWDYKCRSVIHPRHHSIYGYNPETGLPETPWLEKTLYDGMIASGYDRANWQDYIATLTDYVPWTGDKNSLAYQSRDKKPAPELTAEGLVGLDGRYLNNAPQCTGWMDLSRDGGSGSFYISWSGLYKITTVAAIPYYTGQYSPDIQKNRRGFGVVTIGAGIDFFSRPANDMDKTLTSMVRDNVEDTVFHLVWTTAVLSVIVIFIAIWMASYLSKKLRWLINGITLFRQGYRDFRFVSINEDEFGQLARSFDDMADNIVDSVRTPLVITDLDLNIIYVNDESLEYIGDTRENIIGKNYKEKSIYEFQSRYCPITALRNGTLADIAYVAKNNCYLLGSASIFVNEYGEEQGYIIMSNDVSEISRKQIELERAKDAAEQANKHKSQFLARMSHELRTPMNAMIGLNDIVQSKIVDFQESNNKKELSDYLSNMKKASLDLLSLLNDILEVSNLESDTVLLINKPLDLTEMLEELSKKSREECVSKHLEFNTHFECLSVTSFLADGAQLGLVLYHLLSNAIKFTPLGGKVDFSVRIQERRGGQSLLAFSIKDTGIGIDTKNIERIFNPFDQVELEDGQSYGGGLGLTIVQKVLNLFGSQIAIQSEPGKGCEFSFEVWLNEDKKESNAEIEYDIERYKGQKALIIDDVRINRFVLNNLMREFGFISDEAQDGKEGLEKFKQSPVNQYDIIFMDIQMPVMDGYESARAIRALDRADAQTVPIVTISANAFKEDTEKSLASGMNAHYAKPIQKETLSDILQQFCTPVQ